MRKLHILFLLLSVIAVNSYAQTGNVGIGTNMPNANAMLDIVSPDSSRGLLIPRLTETQRDGITNPPDGLLVYNVTENCVNYWSDSANAWVSLCDGGGGGAGATFTFPDGCNGIIVQGTYTRGTALNSLENYIDVLVNVSKPGTYIINAATTNGYAFFTQGTFTNTGQQLVRVPGDGVPKYTRKDTLRFFFNGVYSDLCDTLTVQVKEPVASYFINCSGIAIKGDYLKGTALTSANAASIMVTVAGVLPVETSSWSVESNTVNGISFAGSGTITGSGTKAITIQGSGTPTQYGPIPLTFTFTTPSGVQMCNTLVNVRLPEITYGVIGTYSVWHWSTAQRAKALSSTSGDNFGPNKTVDIVNLKKIWEEGSNVTTAVNNLKNNPPDMVLFMSYSLFDFHTPSTTTTAMANALADYVNAGGVLVYSTNSDGESVSTGQGLTESRAVFNAIWAGSSWSANATTVQWQSSGGGDNTYMIENDPSDPIINGPFGNLAGKYWAEDNAAYGTIVLTQLPPNCIKICSAYDGNNHTTTAQQGYSTVWYSKDKNIFVFGDTNGSESNSTNLVDYPASYSSSGAPLSKPYVSGTVHNAALEMNVINWAIQRALSNGINPH